VSKKNARKKPLPFFYLRLGSFEFTPSAPDLIRIIGTFFIFFCLGSSLLIANSNKNFDVATEKTVLACESTSSCSGTESASKKVKGAFSSLINSDIPDVPAPLVSATAAIVYDGNKDTFLYEKNSSLKLSPASTTKMMTALIAIENLPLDQEITVLSNCVNQVGSKVGFLEGEVLSVESLLYGLLVPSGNDAACALGYSQPDFIALMNKKVRDLDLKDTSFSNPVGLDGNGDHYTTASDLSKIAWEALKNPLFRKFIGTREVVICSTDGKFKHSLSTTNKLLYDFPGTTGVKTGYTEDAGGCFVLSHVFGDRELVTVVLASDNRLEEAEKLTRWAEENFTN